MTAFLPETGRGSATERAYPTLRQRPFSPAEQRARWEVRAAQWRAREIAEAVFGRVASSNLLGIRAQGAMRGLLTMEVPFGTLADHEDRERTFLSAVASDPVLSRVPLVYVFGPESD